MAAERLTRCPVNENVQKDTTSLPSTLLEVKLSSVKGRPRDRAKRYTANGRLCYLTK